MAGRIDLHKLLLADPVEQSIATAPFDDEPDLDDVDGGLTEARREALEGRLIPHDQVKRELGIE